MAETGNDLSTQAERFAKSWLGLEVDDAQRKQIERWAKEYAQSRTAIPSQQAKAALGPAKQRAAKLIDEERARAAKLLADAISAAGKPVAVRAGRDEQALLRLLDEVIISTKARLAGAQIVEQGEEGSRERLVATTAEGLAQTVREEIERHLQQKLAPLAGQLKAVIENAKRDSGQDGDKPAPRGAGRGGFAKRGRGKRESAKKPLLALPKNRIAGGSRGTESGV